MADSAIAVGGGGRGGGGGLDFRSPADIFTGATLAACRTARNTYFAAPANASVLAQYQGNQSLAIVLDPGDTTDNTFETYLPGQSGQDYDATQWVERTDAIQGNTGPTGPQGDWNYALFNAAEARSRHQVREQDRFTAFEPDAGINSARSPAASDIVRYGAEHLDVNEEEAVRRELGIGEHSTDAQKSLVRRNLGLRLLADLIAGQAWVGPDADPTNIATQAELNTHAADVDGQGHVTAAERTRIAAALTEHLTGPEIVVLLSALTGGARLPASAIRDLPSGGGAVAVQDEGVQVTADGRVFDFRGDGVVAQIVNGTVRVTIPGGTSPAPGTHTRYAAVRANNNQFTAADFEGGGATSSTTDEITLPTWASGTRYLAFAIPADQPDLTEFREQGGTLNQIATLDKQTGQLTIAGAAHNWWLFDSQLLQSTSATTWIVR